MLGSPTLNHVHVIVCCCLFEGQGNLVAPPPLVVLSIMTVECSQPCKRNLSNYPSMQSADEPIARGGETLVTNLKTKEQ